jgi:hypothetical protein
MKTTLIKLAYWVGYWNGRRNMRRALRGRRIF